MCEDNPEQRFMRSERKDEMTLLGFRFALTLVLLIGVLLFQAGQLQAQCSVINTNSFLTSAPTTVFVTKTLSAATSCMQTALVMADQCFPCATSFSTAMLYAVRTGSSPSPICVWDCNCGTVTISGAEGGLPVELMDFQISSLPEPATPEAEETHTDGGRSPES